MEKVTPVTRSDISYICDRTSAGRHAHASDVRATSPIRRKTTPTLVDKLYKPKLNPTQISFLFNAIDDWHGNCFYLASLPLDGDPTR